MGRHSNFQKKNSLKPITDEEIQLEKEQHPVDENHFTDNTNIDAYIDSIESDPIRENKIEIEKLNEEIKNLKNENSKLLSEIDKLKKSASSENINELNKKISELEKERDDFILRASDLEFNLAKSEESVKNLQAKIDNFNKTRTVVKYNPTPNERFVKSNDFPRFNGYESWA